jgi:hypothetical protein
MWGCSIFFISYPYLHLFLFFLSLTPMSSYEGLKGKNDYSVTVYVNGEKRLFTEYVHSIVSYYYWLKKNSIQWDYILIYVRRTRAILCFYKNGDHLHAFPDFEIKGRIKQGW